MTASDVTKGRIEPTRKLVIVTVADGFELFENMKTTPPKITLLTLAAVGLLPLLSPAASITLTNSDAVGTSSFNTKGLWNSDSAPTAGNDYFTGPQYRLRTPVSGSSFTFGGDSLTINSTNGVNGGFMYKGTGATGILTINNMILDGGWIHHQNGSGDICRIAGNITVLSPSRIDNKQGPIFIDATLQGSGTITNANVDNVDRTTTYTADNSTFTGRMVILGANTRVTITNENNLGGNPAVFTPDQLQVESGWLQTGVTNDVVLNDANRGITLNGTWSLNPQAGSALTIAVPIVGNGEIWKRGPGVLTLAGDNSGHFGGVRLGAFSAGSQLNVNSANALGFGTFTIPNDGNQPTLDNTSGGAITVAGNNIQNWNRNFTFLGSSSLNMGSGSVTLGNNVTVTVSNNTLSVGAIFDDGLIRSLTKQGPGTLVVDGGANHLGNTVVNEGTLTLLNAALPSSPVITVASNATLNVSGPGLALAFGQTLAGSGTVIGNVSDGTGSSGINPGGTGFGTLTINGGLALNGSGALNFNLSGSFTVGNGVNDLLIVSGALNLAGPTTLNVLGTPATGTYTLIQYGSFAGDLANVTPPPGFTLNNNTAAKTIELVAAHIPVNLTWRGDGAANLWDLGTTPNWIAGGSPASFFNTDTVTFDNSGSNTPAITLATDVSPAAVIVNASQDYTFTGGGIVSGSLTKSGSGTLILDNTNTYSGATVITSGTLQVGDPTSGSFGFAGTIGTGPVTNNAVLQFARSGGDALNIATAIEGSGSISNIGLGGLVSLNGKVSGTTVNQAGVGSTLRLTASNDYTGLTLVSGGTLSIHNTNALGSTAAGTVVSGGNLYYDFGQPMIVTGEALTLDGGTLQRGGAQVLTYDAPITLGAAGGTFNTDGGATILPAQPITGAGALTKAGGGTLILAGPNSYSGKTFLNAGTVLIADQTALGQTPVAATPDFVTFNGGTLAVTNDQIFSGGLRGLTVGSAAFLNAGAGATLTVSGDLSGGGNLSKRGAGTLVLSGTNPWFGAALYLDSTSGANDGTTRIVSASALANLTVSPGVPTIFQGNNNAGYSTLQLDGSAGGITLPQEWSMNCRNNDVPNIQNLAGNNTISGNIQLNVGGSRVNFQSDAGLLTFSGAFDYVGTSAAGRSLVFIGAGDVLVSGTINAAANGAPISVTKGGTGRLALSGANTYAGATIISNGVFNLTGSISSTGGVSVAGGALAGNGTINDNVTVQASIPSDTLDGLTVNGNYTISGVLAVDANRSGFAADFTTVSGTLSATGGSIQVNNLGANLQVGDTFILFNKPVAGGGALGVVGGGATWNNNLAVDGTIQVASVVPTTPTTITATPGAGTLDLNWPVSHLGWVLQTQTNALTVGIATNWVDVPGSASVTSVSIAINPANPTVFFRLRYP
jgi:fibronectin-binding autotransporter adhesin